MRAVIFVRRTRKNLPSFWLSLVPQIRFCCARSHRCRNQNQLRPRKLHTHTHTHKPKTGPSRSGLSCTKARTVGRIVVKIFFLVHKGSLPPKLLVSFCLFAASQQRTTRACATRAHKHIILAGLHAFNLTCPGLTLSHAHMPCGACFMATKQINRTYATRALIRLPRLFRRGSASATPTFSSSDDEVSSPPCT